MVESFIRLPEDGIGKKTRTQIVTIGSNNVHEQVIIDTESLLIEKMSYINDGFPEYIGKALPGTLSSSAAWRIKKLTYSGMNVTDIQFADGDTNFDNIWDNRESLNYS